MAETVTSARPYAEAVFELAKQQKSLPQWSEMLAFSAAVASSPDVRALDGNPRITSRQLSDLLIGIGGDWLNGEARNLIQVLVQNRRLSVLPEIRELFERMKEEHEGQVEALITSALPLSDEQTRRLAVVGDDERQAGVVVIKNLASGEQTALRRDAVAAFIRAGGKI